jgi:pyruvate dehydrogenase E1 component alpha subunit
MMNTCMADRVEGGWGIPATRVDGSDAVATLVALRGAVERARSGAGPQAVEAVTLRLDGHAAHDDGRYMDQAQLADYAEQRDPVERLAARLRLDGLSEDEVEALRTEAAAEVSAGLQAAEASPAPDPATILDGVYATKLT